MKIINYISALCFLLLLGASNDLQAQLKADFVADTLSFCPPHSVGFKDLSTGGGTIISRRWSFGQGGTSNTNNSSPSAFYTTAGYYTVKLVVSDSSSSDSIVKVAYIKAFKIPKVDFTTTQKRSGCAPLSIHFLDSIALGNAPIRSYSWNFGNGNRSNLKNPFHKYLNDGNYTVVLRVVDTNGCTDSKSKTQFIKVIKSPKALFSVTPVPNSCNPPHKVTFVNQSKGTGNLTYLWKFGNGDSSTIKNPGYTFKVGAYDITLIVKNATGCTDTLVKKRYITVGAPKADFSVIDTFCLSDSNSFSFKNLSVGANTFLWNFGDGVISSFKTPSHRYFQKGRFKVRLIIGLATPCSDTMDKYIQVIQPQASFTTDLNYWCNDTAVEYTPGGTYLSEAKTMLWAMMYYGYPAYKRIYSSPVRKVKTIKKVIGQHYDTLTLYYPKWGSCSSKVILNRFRLWKPPGRPIITPFTGCAPLTVKFLDSIMPRDSLNVGTWVFDGTTRFKGRRTYRTYKKVGTYKATYYVKHSKFNCNYKYGEYNIKAGARPKADFTVLKKVFCANEKVQFWNLSTDSTKINGYSWKFDSLGGVPPDFTRHPKVLYKDTGYKDIRLIVDDNGCLDTIIKKKFFKIVGPIGEIKEVIDCEKPYSRKYLPLNWVDVQRFKYDFGDTLGYDSINRSPTYKYGKRGDYVVKVNLYNDSTGCMDSVFKTISIRDVKLISNINRNFGCFPSFYTFKTDSSQDVVRGRIIAYGSDKSMVDSIFRRFDMKAKTKGYHQPMLIGYDINNCPDTNLHWVKTYGPTAKFSVSPDSGCAPLLVNMIDSSFTDTTFSSMWWKGSEGNLSTLKNPNFTFVESGRKLVELYVRDTLGCIGKTAKYVYVFMPRPSISADTQVCTGVPVIFTNKRGLPGDTHLWNFGDSLTGSGKVSKIIYSKAGRKSIQLKVTDVHGCDSTINRNLWIEVQKAALPTVVSDPNDTTCYPAEIDFFIKNRDSTAKFYFWRFDSADAFIRLSGSSTFYNFTKPGYYGVDIGVETTFGCRDTFRIDSILRVRGPYARFDMEDTFCFGFESRIKLKEVSGVYQFKMDFGDGILDTFPGTTNLIIHKYSNSGFYPVSLIFTDSLGDCVKSQRDSLYIQDIKSKINLINSKGCPPFSLFATADTANVDNYEWWVNGVLLDTNQQFSKTFLKSNTYNLTLRPINKNTGCFGLDSIQFTVFPVPTLSKFGDGLVCYQDSITIGVSGARYYLWTPSTYLANPESDTTRLLPEKDISYHVVGTNKFGCQNYIDLKLKVVKPPYIKSMEDTTLFLGQSMNLNQEIPGNWDYKWTPALFLSCSKCPNPKLKANRNITYTLTVSDKFGCFNLDSSFSVIVKDEYKLFIPNAFTPNEDGLNEKFDFYAEGFKEMEYFRIYTRWGDLVYEFQGINDGWDGLYKGEYWPTNASLVYKGRFVRYSNEVVEVMGTVTLVR